MRFSRAPILICTVVLLALGAICIRGQTRAGSSPLATLLACTTHVHAAVAPTGSAAPEPPPPSPPDRDSHEYPAVVARVNGTPIAGWLLAAEENGVEQALPHLTTNCSPRALALKQLIEDQVLLQTAAAHGVTVSDAEVGASIASQHQTYEQAAQANPEQARQQLSALAALDGTTVDKFWTDPNVVATYREAITIGTMRQRIWQSQPTGRPTSDEASQQAIDRYVDQSGARIEILILF